MSASIRTSCLLALVWFAAGAAAFGAIPEDFVRQGYDVSPTVNLSVRNTAGRIFIFGSVAPRLEIVAMRRAFTKERLEAIRVEVSIEGETAKIETIYPAVPERSGADRSGTVDYLILVPQTCTLAAVELANGEMLIEGMRGSRVEARLGRGVLHLRNCFSAVRLSLDRGKMNVRYAWWETRDFSISAEVNDGEVRLAVPAGAAMHFDAATESGKIVSHFNADPRRLPKLDEHFGGESAVEFKFRLTTGDLALERAY